MLHFPYPSAFSVPICSRCSSTIRVIVVRLTRAATRKKIKGNTFPIAPIRSASLPNSTYVWIAFLSSTYHSGSLISSMSFWASSIFLPASAIFSSASCLESSYLTFASAKSASPSSSFFCASSISASPFAISFSAFGIFASPSAMSRWASAIFTSPSAMFR